MEETILILALAFLVTIVLMTYSSRNLKDKPARDAIKIIGNKIGYSDITFYESLGEALVHKTTEEIEAACKDTFPVQENIVKQRKDFMALLSYLGLELFEGREIRKKKKEVKEK